jgi:V-type H+-transporting ATPase proteolipid subunit
MPRSIIFCEAVAIYGVIVAIILQTKVEAVKPAEDGSYSLAAANGGYAVLGAGSVTGWANLACGWVRYAAS